MEGVEHCSIRLDCVCRCFFKCILKSRVCNRYTRSLRWKHEWVFVRVLADFCFQSLFCTEVNRLCANLTRVSYSIACLFAGKDNNRPYTAAVNSLYHSKRKVKESKKHEEIGKKYGNETRI
jgi:hypothetical protein